VSIPATSTAIAGDIMPVAAAVDINGNNRIWVGYTDFTVAAADAVANLNVSTTHSHERQRSGLVSCT